MNNQTRSKIVLALRAAATRLSAAETLGDLFVHMSPNLDEKRYYKYNRTFDGDQHYFLPREQLKNGGVRGLIVVDALRGRLPKRAKIDIVDKRDLHNFDLIPRAELNPAVTDRFDEWFLNNTWKVKAAVVPKASTLVTTQARSALEETTEAIAARVRFLGEGMEGQAYETPDDLVLKVTNNAMTAQNARKLMRKPQRNFVHIYKVEPVFVRKGKQSEKQYHIYMENLSPPSKEWRAFANAIWAGALTKRPSAAAKRYLRKAGPLPSKIRWYRNVLAQAKILRLPILDIHEDNIMMRGRLPVVIDP